MENILKMLNEFQSYVVIGLIAAVIILFILCLILLKAINDVEKKYRKFMRGVNSKNLEELIIKYLDNIDEVKNDTENMKEFCNNMDGKLKSCLQKISILRYKAFEDVGSDLSFSIALLDYNNDGVILTGIYGRNESTTYAKPIDKGISRYDLSEEEEEVLKSAMNKK